MTKNEKLLRMFQVLEKNNIYCSNSCYKDINKIVTTNINTFIEKFSTDFLRKKFEQYNRFEKLNDKQKNALNGNSLYRYEYRENSNFRCIYIIEEGENIILLSAFNEDGNKKAGKNSYNDNIEKAINIYNKEVKDE